MPCGKPLAAGSKQMEKRLPKFQEFCAKVRCGAREVVLAAGHWARPCRPKKGQHLAQQASPEKDRFYPASPCCGCPFSPETNQGPDPDPEIRPA